MYHSNKSQLLKIFEPTFYLTGTLKKKFSEILRQLLPLPTLADEVIKFVRNLSSGLFTYCHSFW